MDDRDDQDVWTGPLVDDEDFAAVYVDAQQRSDLEEAVRVWANTAPTPFAITADVAANPEADAREAQRDPYDFSTYGYKLDVEAVGAADRSMMIERLNTLGAVFEARGWSYAIASDLEPALVHGGSWVALPSAKMLEASATLALDQDEEHAAVYVLVPDGIERMRLAETVRDVVGGDIDHGMVRSSGVEVEVRPNPEADPRNVDHDPGDFLAYPYKLDVEADSAAVGRAEFVALLARLGAVFRERGWSYTIASDLEDELGEDRLHRA